MNALVCRNAQRREAVRKESCLHGLDYLEVDGKDRRTLTVYFLGKAPSASLQPANVIIEGGRRIRDIRVTKISIHRPKLAGLDDYMEVVTDKEGDFSTYTLRMVYGHDEAGKWRHHPAFDVRYDRVEFSFKVDCPSDLDCRQNAVCPTEKPQEPPINYLAKDYASFRQLMFDRLALLTPEWRERHVPDLGVTLVELLAYVGDHLSYYQDAVATEAYLDTARQRISVRRHVRLVDYPMHEGCNARTWVYVETDSDFDLPDKAYFITGFEQLPSVISQEELQRRVSGGYEVFEPVRLGNALIRLHAGQHEIRFHDWGDKECCLPKGSVRATLIGKLVGSDGESGNGQTPADGEPVIIPPTNQDSPKQKKPSLPAVTPPAPQPLLHLQPGDILMFEEVLGPKTGNSADADPKHRHAVRLTAVYTVDDPLSDQSLTEIEWSEKDALPFPLCISAQPSNPPCEIITDISIARGNLILVDHGLSIEEELEPVSAKQALAGCDCMGGEIAATPVPTRYEPVLFGTQLTFSQPIPADLPAASLLSQDERQALPCITLTGDLPDGKSSTWYVRRDLFESNGKDCHFVAELNNDGGVRLRFGNDELGRRPPAGMQFRASYRVGNGPAGNVGAEAIQHLVYRDEPPAGGISAIRNPLPAKGGTAPEPLAEVRLFAPHTFRKRLERAITSQDYADIVLREFPHKVQRAAAQLRWNGSWHEVLVAIDPLGQEEADQTLLDAIAGRLHRYRRIGHDVVVRSAQLVPLDIELKVCVAPGYQRGHVKTALLDVFSNRRLLDGRFGFFHPDNLTFGAGVYLGKLVAVAQAIPGVLSVTVAKLQRQYEPANSEIENGVLPLGPLEIARLDNDPGFPEYGQLSLTWGI